MRKEFKALKVVNALKSFKPVKKAQSSKKGRRSQRRKLFAKGPVVYSRLSEIPGGLASETLIPGCLVLEGGAFRGLYTQGFLDAMMQNDLNLSCVIGVSAGALSGMNYVAGQIGRSARTNLTYRRDSRYVGTKAVLKSHSLLDIGFLVEDRGGLEPLNWERFNREEQRFIAVATNCETGEAAYFEKGKCSDIMQAVRASATMPYISPMVMIDGVPYLDGGCACKIPYEWALQEGFSKILVIRTRESAYRKAEKVSKSATRIYKKYPAFAEKLSVSNLDYNRQCEEIEALHAAGRLLRFAPSKPVEVSRLERNMEKLGELYWIGYQDCLNALDEIREYLGCTEK